jgi:phosphopantothenoylcysteine decarboxylase/phosphopantothenate--cysteine ligase
MTTSPEVLLAVSGGIAAYKTAMLASHLVQDGLGVTVVITRHARRFVGTATMAALTGRPVVTQMIDPCRFPLGPHIELARRAQLYCLAPATANCLAKLALGIADDVVTASYLSFQGPVLLAPAMNAEMWEKPSVQRNVRQLESDGVTFIGPEAGWLSCRDVGAGRMAEPAAIAERIHQLLKTQTPS